LEPGGLFLLPGPTSAGLEVSLKQQVKSRARGKHAFVNHPPVKCVTAIRHVVALAYQRHLTRPPPPVSSYTSFCSITSIGPGFPFQSIDGSMKGGLSSHYLVGHFLTPAWSSVHCEVPHFYPWPFDPAMVPPVLFPDYERL